MVSETTNTDSSAFISVRKNVHASGTERALILQEHKHGVSHEIGLDLLHPIIQPQRQTSLDVSFDYPGLSSEDWSFEQLSDFYKHSNIICMSNALGVNYKHSHFDKGDLKNLRGRYRGSKINRILCSKFHCDRCRLLLKYKLKTQIQNALVEHKLYTHFVVTTAGTNYRDTNDYIQSYFDMSKAWNKIRKILSADAKKQGKQFSYICLPRAQRNGYCHLHVLTNVYIPKQRLKDISNLYFNTGFISIKSNKDITKYLTNDFMKDHEFYIPFSRRHYSCSRNIKLKIYDEIVDEDLVDPETSMHINLRPPGIPIVDQIYEQIEHEFGYPPPFDFLLAQFTKTLTSTGEKSKTFFVDGKIPPKQILP